MAYKSRLNIKLKFIEQRLKLLFIVYSIGYSIDYFIQWWGVLTRKKSELHRINTIIKPYLQHRTEQK